MYLVLGSSEKERFKTTAVFHPILERGIDAREMLSRMDRPALVQRSAGCPP